MQLRNYCKDLEKILLEIKNNVNEIQGKETCKNCVLFIDLKSKLNKLILERESNVDDSFETASLGIERKITLDASTSTESFENVCREINLEEINQLKNKCAELENCIDLLKNEYERCEDYWASKLDDERQMFEQEQNQSSEKLTELFAKIAEYESQFAQQDMVDNRLPPIEEKYNLEKQFTDLEEEYDDFRDKTEMEINEKICEIANLKEKLEEATHKKQGLEVAVQVEFPYPKIDNLSNHVIESTNLFSSDTMPNTYSKNNTEIEPESITTCNESIPIDTVNLTFVWNGDSTQDSANVDSISSSETASNSIADQNISLPTNPEWQKQNNGQNSFPTFNIPSSSGETQNGVPCRPKRTRKHERNLLSSQRLHKKGNNDKDIKTHNEEVALPAKWKGFNDINGKAEEQKCIVSVGTINNLNGRIHQLEQRCRQLQMVLKQQHFQAEQMLQRKYYCW